MVVNKVFDDPRGVNCVFCYTDTAIPLDSIITFDGEQARISKVFTSEEGWNPGPESSNQGVIGFSYTGQNYTFGDTFIIFNSSFSLPVSGYVEDVYGYLNFTSYLSSGDPYPGSNIYAEQNYLNVGINDFTIELFARFDSLRGNQILVSFEGPGVFPSTSIFGLLFYDNETAYINATLRIQLPGFSFFSFNGFFDGQVIQEFEEYRWYHIAIVRTSGELYCYVDGVSANQVAELPYDYSNITTTRFGAINVYGYAGFTSVFALSGAISNIRITANEALYNTNFIPPTLPLTSGPNTTLLMLADSEANKYVNSVDNVVFTNDNDPTTGEPVYWTNGPILYPHPPPVYYVYWTPLSDLMNWSPTWNGESVSSNINALTFNTSDPGFDNFSQVRGLIFNNAESNLTSLTGLNFLTNLQYLQIGTQPSSLSSIDISQNLNLTNLSLNYIPTLTSVDTTNNLLLSALVINTVNLQEINLNNNTLVTDLNIEHTAIKTINLSSLPLLEFFIMGNNSLSSVQGLQALDNVNYFYLNNNALSSININDMNSLVSAFLQNNNISSITLSSCPVLVNLNLSHNSFTEVPDFSNTSITSLYLNSNSIRSFNPNYSKASLTTLQLTFNYVLSSVNLSNFSNLQNIQLYYNALSSVDLSYINTPINIGLNNNNITSLSLPISTAVAWNPDVSINISDNIDLTTTSISGVKPIKTFIADYCSFPQSVVDRLFLELSNIVYNGGKTNGLVSIRYGNNAAPSSASSYERALLAAYGWAVYYN